MTAPISPDPSVPWAGGAYSIKRHGVTLTNCASEPVQTPGCIQAHGALLVVRRNDLTILQASENTLLHLAHPPEELLGQSIAKILGEEGRARLVRFLEEEPLESNPLFLFTLPAQTESGPLDVLAHTIDGVVILEFEATSRNNQSPPDYYALVKKSLARLQTAQTLSDFCRLVAEEVHALTGLDRVMVYRFHEDFHGEVVAESKRPDLPPWLGLHYPAEDIPQPARAIFHKIWIRPLPDATAPLMEMMPLVNPDSGRPLTMTYCALRGASVMYAEYLANMGVSASLTMPIRPEGQLWGLIACHHEKPTQFSYQIRAACEFLAQVASLQLRGAEQREGLTYRLKLEEVHNGLLARAARELSLEPLTETQPTLLDGMDAAGAALFHGGRWWTVGHTPTTAQLDALRAWLDTRVEFDSPTRPCYASDSLIRDYPPAAAFAEVASGLLAVPLARRHQNLMLWFRPETMQTVNWGGNPHDKPAIPGPHGPRLTPRKSFEIFAESVRHRARPWKDVEVAAALRLRGLIMELVVTRAEQLAELNIELTRSNEELDAFAYVASHDLKEPLRGISKYAHQILENAAADDVDSRKRLQAIGHLTLRMDGLLDSLLHFSRFGRTALDFISVDLNQIVAEALEMVEVRRQEVPTQIVIPRSLPSFAGDRVRVREIFVNLIGNALKYNDKPERRVEIGYFAPGEPDAPRLSPEFSSIPIFYVRDNGLGIEHRHFALIFKLFKRLHGRDEHGGGSGAGLTIVQKLVEQHQGRIWLDSEIGLGSTFYFTLSSSEVTPP